MEGALSRRRGVSGNLLLAGGILTAAAVPSTVTILVLSSVWFQSFFSGPAILWPVIGILAGGYLGFRAIQDGQSAKAGVLHSSHGIVMRGYLGIVGAGLLLGGLLSLLGGALVISAGLTISREEGAAVTKLSHRYPEDIRRP